MTKVEVGAKVFTEANLVQAEWDERWLIAPEKQNQFMGYVLASEIGEGKVELPLMKVEPDEAICWLDARRSELALPMVQANTELIINLPEKPAILIGLPSSKSEGVFNITAGMVQIMSGDQTIKHKILRGGKRDVLEKTGIKDLTFFTGSEESEDGLWMANDAEGNVCFGVKCTPITGKATNEPKYFYWTEYEWGEVLKIIQANPDRSVVGWDDVYSTGASLNGVRALFEAKIAMTNEIITERNKGESLIKMDHFYQVVTAFEAPNGVQPPADLRYAIQIPVVTNLGRFKNR